MRLFGEALRTLKEPLARLVTLENGKILEEARGEVQEMIDMCDFAVGLSRQLYGLTIASERPDHRLHETWLPLGPIGVITAFNFPVAGLGVERGPGARVRRSSGLETLGQNALTALPPARPCLPAPARGIRQRPDTPSLRACCRCLSAMPGWQTGWSDHSPPSYQCDGELPHGAPGSAESGGASGAKPPGAGRQQWGHRE